MLSSTDSNANNMVDGNWATRTDAVLPATLDYSIGNGCQTIETVSFKTDESDWPQQRAIGNFTVACSLDGVTYGNAQSFQGGDATAAEGNRNQVFTLSPSLSSCDKIRLVVTSCNDYGTATRQTECWLKEFGVRGVPSPCSSPG